MPAHKDSFDVFCPSCNIMVEAKVVAHGSGGYRSDAVSPLEEIDTEYHGEHYSVCTCARCNQPFLVRESYFGIPAEFESVTDTKVLYPSESKLPLEGLPETIQSAYDQAARSFTAALYEPCVLMCRKCLEATCGALGASGRNLDSKLTGLFEAGKIDARLLDWAHGIRLVGNEAAHDITTNVTKTDARDVLDFTEAILIYVFSLTTRFDAFKTRRQKASKVQDGAA